MLVESGLHGARGHTRASLRLSGSGGAARQRALLTRFALRRRMGRRDRRRLGRLPQRFGRYVMLCDNDWAAKARLFTLLTEPAAVAANCARRELVDCLWNYRHCSMRKSAAAALEVLAGGLDARRRKAENLRCADWMREAQQIVRHRLGHVEIQDPLVVHCSADHAKYDASVHIRLGTRADCRPHVVQSRLSRGRFARFECSRHAAVPSDSRSLREILRARR